MRVLGPKRRARLRRALGLTYYDDHTEGYAWRCWFWLRREWELLKVAVWHRPEGGRR